MAGCHKVFNLMPTYIKMYGTNQEGGMRMVIDTSIRPGISLRAEPAGLQPGKSSEG